MKLGILAAVAALAVASPVVASDWRFSTSNDDTLKGFDFDSLIVTGSRRTVWEVMVYKTANEFGTDYFVSRTEYDCVGSRYRDIAVAAYAFGKDTPDTMPTRLEWITVFPDTISEGSLRTVCGLDPTETVGVTTVKDFAEIGRLVLLDQPD